MHCYVYSVAWVLAALLLAACQTPPAEISKPSSKQVLETLSPQGYVNKSVEYLAVGDEKNARLYLQQATNVAPDSRAAKTARFLLEQMNVDPKQYLGKDSFPYRVQRGESLTLLAKRFLGNSLKFYILARYNNIANPSYLEVGQVIRIPGKRQPEPVRTATISKPAKTEKATLSSEPELEDEIIALPAPLETSDTPEISPSISQSRSSDKLHQQAKQLYDAEDYRDAIALLEEASSLEQKSADLLVESYQAEANELRAHGQLRAAKNQLEQAFTLKPTDDTIQQQLDEVNRMLDGREADRLYQQGLAEQKRGELEEAYETLSRVLNLDPSHTAARQQANEIKVLLVENYHRQALTLYKSQQELCKAIVLWDKVLVLDPTYTSALTNQQTARKVVEKLGRTCP